MTRTSLILPIPAKTVTDMYERTAARTETKDYLSKQPLSNMTDPMMMASIMSREIEREETSKRKLATATVTPMRILDLQPEAASEVAPEVAEVDSSRTPNVMQQLLAKKEANEHDD